MDKVLKKAARCWLCDEPMAAGELFRWKADRIATSHRGDYRTVWRVAHVQGAPCFIEKDARQRQQERARTVERAVASMREHGASDELIELFLTTANQQQPGS